MKRIFTLPLSAALVISLLTACGILENQFQSRYDEGLSLLAQGEYEEAIQAFDAAVRLASHRPEPYVGRADAYAALAGGLDRGGEEQKNARQLAQADYEKAMELDHANQQVRQKLIDFYVSLGDELMAAEGGADVPEESCARARAYYESALALNYANADVYQRLAELLLSQGELEQAAAMLEKGFTASHNEKLGVRLNELNERIAEQAREKLRAAALEPLAMIPYYGDTSICQMTAEQALAYAQLIADGILGKFKGFGGYGQPLYDGSVFWDEPYAVMCYGAYETDRANVMLGDFAGDGNPYLYLFSSLVDKNSFEVYGWADGKVKLALGEESYGSRQEGTLTETDDGSVVMEEAGATGTDSRQCQTYEFQRGTASVSRAWEETWNSEEDVMRVMENGVEKTYTGEEWARLSGNNAAGEDASGRALSYPSLAEVETEACTLRDMVKYLNAYASALSGGVSDPVSVPEEHSQRHLMAAAMLRKIFDLQNTPDESGQRPGLCAVRLSDLDGDGVPELFAAFRKPYSAGDGVSCQFILYQWRDGALVEYPGGRALDEIHLVREKSSGEYGIVGVEYGDTTRYHYTFLSHSEQTRSESEKYFVVRNGEAIEITESEYMAVHAKYEESQIILDYRELGENSNSIQNYNNTILTLNRMQAE